MHTYWSTHIHIHAWACTRTCTLQLLKDSSSVLGGTRSWQFFAYFPSSSAGYQTGFSLVLLAERALLPPSPVSWSTWSRCPRCCVMPLHAPYVSWMSLGREQSQQVGFVGPWIIQSCSMDFCLSHLNSNINEAMECIIHQSSSHVSLAGWQCRLCKKKSKLWNLEPGTALRLSKCWFLDVLFLSFKPASTHGCYFTFTIKTRQAKWVCTISLSSDASLTYKRYTHICP